MNLYWIYWYLIVSIIFQIIVIPIDSYWYATGHDTKTTSVSVFLDTIRLLILIYLLVT